MSVSLGSSRLLASGHLKGRQVGIVSNPASVDANYVHVVDALMNAPGVTVGALFGPQHGFRSDVQDNMEAFWQPGADRHGSYFIGWTNTQEVRWKQNYRIWMDALRDFGVKGGLITTGDDAGYIWSLYGFGLIRELELHEIVEHRIGVAGWSERGDNLGMAHRVISLQSVAPWDKSFTTPSMGISMD